MYPVLPASTTSECFFPRMVSSGGPTVHARRPVARRCARRSVPPPRRECGLESDRWPGRPAGRISLPSPATCGWHQEAKRVSTLSSAPQCSCPSIGRAEAEAAAIHQADERDLRVRNGSAVSTQHVRVAWRSWLLVLTGHCAVCQLLAIRGV